MLISLTTNISVSSDTTGDSEDRMFLSKFRVYDVVVYIYSFSVERQQKEVFSLCVIHTF